MTDLDPDFTLEDLLTAKDIDKLQKQLAILLGSPVSIVAIDHTCDSRAFPIRYQISPIAHLLTEASELQAQAAVALVQTVIYQAARYRLSSVAHHAVVIQDYEELQIKHQQLQESEARYRELAAQLEQRVQDQVRQIELQQRQIYEAEKLSALAQLGAGVAHEINNPLGFIQSNMNSGSGYLEEIRQAIDALASGQDAKAVIGRFDLDFVLNDLQTLMTETRDGVSRVAKIVRDLKGFVSTDTSTRQPLIMGEVLESVCNLAHPLFGERIRLTTDYRDVSPIVADKAALCQAIYAALLNAVQAVGQSGEIWVQCSEQNQTISVDIQDNGEGMDAATLARIFEPFFTTKPVGSGTGLGMTVCRDIVRAHGGDIQVFSKPGEGTRVRIELPADL